MQSIFFPCPPSAPTTKPFRKNIGKRWVNKCYWETPCMLAVESFFENAVRQSCALFDNTPQLSEPEVSLHVTRTRSHKFVQFVFTNIHITWTRCHARAIIDRMRLNCSDDNCIQNAVLDFNEGHNNPSTVAAIHPKCDANQNTFTCFARPLAHGVLDHPIYMFPIRP